MSDVMVRPVRSYLEGQGLVHQGDEPYSVSRSRAVELRSNGLVEWVELEEEEATEPEPAPTPEAPKPRGRRSA